MLIFILHTKTVRNCSYTYQCETSPVVLAWSAWFKILKKIQYILCQVFFSLYISFIDLPFVFFVKFVTLSVIYGVCCLVYCMCCVKRSRL
jgi:hypothetical protein